MTPSQQVRVQHPWWAGAHGCRKDTSLVVLVPERFQRKSKLSKTPLVPCPPLPSPNTNLETIDSQCSGGCVCGCPFDACLAALRGPQEPWEPQLEVHFGALGIFICEARDLRGIQRDTAQKPRNPDSEVISLNLLGLGFIEQILSTNLCRRPGQSLCTNLSGSGQQNVPSLGV